MVPPYVGLAIRPNRGYWEYVKVNSDDLTVEGISALDFLKFKEMIFDENWYFQILTDLFKILHL